MGVDGVEDGFGELMLFEQVAKLQERGSVGRYIAGEINTDETADGLAIVDGIFHPFVRVTEALLCDVHPQHPDQPLRWVAKTRYWDRTGQWCFPVPPMA